MPPPLPLLYGVVWRFSCACLCSYASCCAFLLCECPVLSSPVMSSPVLSSPPLSRGSAPFDPSTGSSSPSAHRQCPLTLLTHALPTQTGLPPSHQSSRSCASRAIASDPGFRRRSRAWCWSASSTSRATVSRGSSISTLKRGASSCRWPRLALPQRRRRQRRQRRRDRRRVLRQSSSALPWGSSRSSTSTTAASAACPAAFAVCQSCADSMPRGMISRRQKRCVGVWNENEVRVMTFMHL